MSPTFFFTIELNYYEVPTNIIAITRIIELHEFPNLENLFVETTA